MITEHHMQARFFAVIRRTHPNLLAFAIPNGFLKTKTMRIRAWREGVLSGVPDVFIPMPRGSHHGLFLEFKTTKGRVSPTQQEFLNLVASRGYRAEVVYSLKQALEVLKDYMHEDP